LPNAEAMLAERSLLEAARRMVHGLVIVCDTCRVAMTIV